MGFEYRLSFAYSSQEAVEEVLSRQMDATRLDKPYSGFEFRRDILNVGMPDAIASVEEYGLYFCDHGGGGRDYLGRLVTSLVDSFGDIVVSEG